MISNYIIQIAIVLIKWPHVMNLFFPRSPLPVPTIDEENSSSLL